MTPAIAVLGEALLAVVGLDEVLATGPTKITQEMRRDAAALPKRLRAAMKKFLGGPDSFEPFKLPTPVKFKETMSRLLAPPDDEARIETLSGIEDGAEQLALHQATERALLVLRPFVPIYNRKTATGPKVEPPPDTALARLRRALTIVHDPMRVIDNMESGTLLREEQAVMAGCYPLLYQDVAESVPASLTELVAHKASFELPWRRDRLLRIFLGAETVTPELAARLHLSFQQDKQRQAEAPAGGKAPDIAKQTETATTRVAAK